jgi:nitrite reductase/ring-hydroxylating ferredoxin subunit/uncharacterized membrane protein
MAPSLSEMAASQAWLQPLAEGLQRPLSRLLGDNPRLGNLLDGVWFGAPLHPALTDVPIGSWTAAAMLDGADVVTGGDRLGPAADAALTVGILAAAPTAAAGLADFRTLGGGEAGRIALVHGGLNTVALSLNVASLVSRRRGRRASGRAWSLLAYAIAATSAHLGGKLSFGLGKRVDHSPTASPTDKFVAVLAEADLADRELRSVDVAGTPVLLTRAENGELCAIADTCSHAGGPLHEGTRDGDIVTCPWHGSRFALCGGAVRQGPAVYPQLSLSVRVRDGQIEIGPPADQ